MKPGRYYLCAEGSPERFVEKQGGQEKQTLWSFYPDSRSLDGAVALNLQSGQNLSGINFQLHTGPVFHIRGKVAGAALPTEGFELTAHMHDLEDIELENQSYGEEDKAGAFDFSGAPAGSYDVEVLSGVYKQIIAKIPVEVKNTDVNGLVVPVPNRFDLKGVVHVLDTASASLSQLSVVARDSLSPFMSHPYAATVKPDGSFEFGHVWPGRYVFSIGGQGDGDYVKSIEYGSEDVLEVPVEMSAGAKLEITVSGGAGQIDGSVQPNDSGVPVDGLEVVLTQETQRGDYGTVRQAKTDQDGHFSFKNLRPGKYYAFAVDDVDRGLLSNRSLIAQLQENGMEIDVPESGQLQLHVPVVRAEDVQRALSILGL